MLVRGLQNWIEVFDDDNSGFTTSNRVNVISILQDVTGRAAYEMKYGLEVRENEMPDSQMGRLQMFTLQESSR